MCRMSDNRQKSLLSGAQHEKVLRGSGSTSWRAASGGDDGLEGLPQDWLLNGRQMSQRGQFGKTPAGRACQVRWRIDGREAKQMHPNRTGLRFEVCFEAFLGGECIRCRFEFTRGFAGDRTCQYRNVIVARVRRKRAFGERREPAYAPIAMDEETYPGADVLPVEQDHTV